MSSHSVQSMPLMYEGTYFAGLLTQNNRGQGNLMISSCLIVLSFTGHENLSLYVTVKFYGVLLDVGEKCLLCLNTSRSL